MSKIKYGQKGYVGFSMSKRATYAYDAGEKPLSKFTAADKDALNELIARYAPESGLVVKTVPQLKAILRKWGESSYHHTGKYANKTEFYHFCALFDLYDADEWEEDITDESLRIFNIRMKAATQLIDQKADK